MLTPCPKLDALVVYATTRGAALLARPGSERGLIIASRPDGTINETEVEGGIGPALENLKQRGYPKAADAVCLVTISSTEIEGQQVTGMLILAAERGAPATHVLLQPARIGLLGRASFTGDLRVVHSRGAVVPAPDLSNFVEGPIEEVAIVAALRDAEHASWAFNRLRALGPDALAALRGLAGSPCALDQAWLATIRDAIDLDNGRIPGSPCWETVAPRVVSTQHPDTKSFAAALAIGMDLMKDADARQMRPSARESARVETVRLAELKRTADVAAAGELIASRPALADFWAKLEKVGWLKDLRPDEIDELRLRLMAASHEDPLNIHYSLADVVFECADIFDEDSGDDPNDDDAGVRGAVADFARASRGRFNPDRRRRVDVFDDEQDEEWPRETYALFTFAGREWRILADFDRGVDQLQEDLNRVLESAGIEERFAALPASDEKRRIVFVRPEVYAAAWQAGAIPYSASGADTERVRPLRALERRHVFIRPVFVPYPIARNGVLIVADDDEMVRVDAPRFERVWSTRAEECWPQWIVGDTVIVLNPKTNATRSLELSSGQVLWETRDAVIRNESASRDWVIQIGESAQFLDPRSGTVQRRIALPPHGNHWMIHHGCLFMCLDEQWCAIDLRDGASLWPSAWPADVTRLLTIRNDGPLRVTCSNGADRVLIVEDRRRLTQIQFDRGADVPAVAWQTEFLVPQGRPVIGGDHLYAFDSGRLRCLDLVTGKIVYDRDHPDVSRGSSEWGMSNGDTVLFVLPHGLREFRASDGAITCAYDGNLGRSWPIALGEGHYVVIDDHGWLTEFST